MAFRDAVTQAAETVQEKVHASRMSPSEAATMLCSLLRESAKRAQHDMSHLLFRAIVRYRAHGVVVPPDAARCAFDAYRATDQMEHMRQLADDIREDEELRLLAVAAYACAQSTEEAMALCETCSAVAHANATRHDILALIAGIPNMRSNATPLVRAILACIEASRVDSDGRDDDVSRRGAAAPSRLTSRDVTDVYADLLRTLDHCDAEAEFDAVVQHAQATHARTSPQLLSAVLRRRLRRVTSTTELADVEAELRNLGYTTDLVCDAMFVTASTRLLRLGDKATEALMLVKTNALLDAVIDKLHEERRCQRECAPSTRGCAQRTSSQGDSADVVDTDGSRAHEVRVSHVCAVLRGLGASGRRTAMSSAWQRIVSACGDDEAMRRRLCVTQAYNEMLRWHAFMGNVADALALKSQMDELRVDADAWTYTWLFRVLGRYYPHHVDLLYDELLQRNVRAHVHLYHVLLTVYADLQRGDRVREVECAMRAREAANTLQLTPNTFAVLIRGCAGDVARAEALFAEAAQRNMAAHACVQTSMVHVLAKGTLARDRAGHGDEDAAAQRARLDAFVSTLPTPFSTELCNVLLHTYSRYDDKVAFDALLRCMVDDGIALDDVTRGTLLTAYSRWRDSAAVAQVVQQMRTHGGSVTPTFYSVLAACMYRLQEGDGVDWAWHELRASGLLPTTRVYSYFLYLYSRRRRNIGRVQHVLDEMMQHVPHNTITATTVVDMLGKLGRVHEMATLFDDMKHSHDARPTAVTFQHVMNAYAKKGDVRRVEAVYADYRAAGYADTAVVYNIRMDAHGRARDVAALEGLRAERAQRGVAADDIMYCILAIAYGRACRDADVTRLFDELVQAASADASVTVLTGRVLWSCIDAFCRCKNVAGVDRCVEWLCRQQHESHTCVVEDSDGGASRGVLSASTLERLIPYYCRMSCMDRVEQAVAAIEQQRSTPRDTGAALPRHESTSAAAPLQSSRSNDDDKSAQATHKHCDEGGDVHSDNADADIVQHGAHKTCLSYATLNCIACGYARVGQLDQVVKYLHKLRNADWVPDARSAMLISAAFVRADLHVQAHQILEWRRQYMLALRDYARDVEEQEQQQQQQQQQQHDDNNNNDDTSQSPGATQEVTPHP